DEQHRQDDRRQERRPQALPEPRDQWADTHGQGQRTRRCDVRCQNQMNTGICSVEGGCDEPARRIKFADMTLPTADIIAGSSSVQESFLDPTWPRGTNRWPGRSRRQARDLGHSAKMRTSEGWHYLPWTAGVPPALPRERADVPSRSGAEFPRGALRFPDPD